MPDSGDLVDPPRARGAGTRHCPRGGPGCVRGATTTTRRQSGGPAPGSGASSASPEAASRHGPSSSCSSVDRVVRLGCPGGTQTSIGCAEAPGRSIEPSGWTAPCTTAARRADDVLFDHQRAVHATGHAGHPRIGRWRAVGAEWYRQWGRLTVFRKDGWPARPFQHGHIGSGRSGRGWRLAHAGRDRWRSAPPEVELRLFPPFVTPAAASTHSIGITGCLNRLWLLGPPDNDTK